MAAAVEELVQVAALRAQAAQEAVAMAPARRGPAAMAQPTWAVVAAVAPTSPGREDQAA